MSEIISNYLNSSHDKSSLNSPNTNASLIMSFSIATQGHPLLKKGDDSIVTTFTALLNYFHPILPIGIPSYVTDEVFSIKQFLYNIY